jgi:hypothetical protein
MNSENLNFKELETLRTLLNKMAGEPKTAKVDPTEVMINNIIHEFDFIKVQNAMFALDWKWAGIGVPTLDQLRNEAHRLLKDAAFSRLYEYKDEHWLEGIQNSTGGFVAMAWCDENKTKIIRLELKFVLTSWDSELEDLDKYVVY